MYAPRPQHAARECVRRKVCNNNHTHSQVPNSPEWAA